MWRMWIFGVALFFEACASTPQPALPSVKWFDGIVVAIVPLQTAGCTADAQTAHAFMIVDRRFSQNGAQLAVNRAPFQYRVNVCAAWMLDSANPGVEPVYRAYVRIAVVDAKGMVRHEGFGEDRFWSQTGSKNFHCFGRVLKRDVLRVADTEICPSSPEEAFRHAAGRAFNNLKSFSPDG